MFSPYATDEAIRAFCDNAEVQELHKQFNEGLLHPVEFAHKILDLAHRAGIVD